MNAAREYFMEPRHSPPRSRPQPEVEERRDDAEDARFDSFWQWFAIGVLVFCWIAEASMCAARGF